MILIFSILVFNFFLLTGLTKGGVETGKIIVLILMLCELLFLICFFLLTGLTKAGVVESGKGLIIAGFRNKYFWQTSISMY